MELLNTNSWFNEKVIVGSWFLVTASKLISNSTEELETFFGFEFVFNKTLINLHNVYDYHVELVLWFCGLVTELSTRDDNGMSFFKYLPTPNSGGLGEA